MIQAVRADQQVGDAIANAMQAFNRVPAVAQGAGNLALICVGASRPPHATRTSPSVNHARMVRSMPAWNAACFSSRGALP